MKETLREAKLIISFASFSFLPLDVFVGRIAREIWCTYQEFPLSISFHHGSPCSYITWGKQYKIIEQYFSYFMLYVLCVFNITSDDD
jgi:hypothetical protein